MSLQDETAPSLMLEPGSGGGRGHDVEAGWPAETADRQRPRVPSVGGFGSVAASGVLGILDWPGSSTAAVAAAAIAAYERGRHDGSGAASSVATTVGIRGRGTRRPDAGCAPGVAGRGGTSWAQQSGETVGAKQSVPRVIGAGFRVQSASAASGRTAGAGGLPGSDQGWRATQPRGYGCVEQHPPRLERGAASMGGVACDEGAGVAMHVGHVKKQLQDAGSEVRQWNVLEGAALSGVTRGHVATASRQARPGRPPGGKISSLLGSHKPDLA